MSEYLNIGLDITGLLDNSPTYGKGPAIIVCRGIEYMPVRHGHWEGKIYKCSLCGKWIDPLQGDADMNYCPNCGARMDGGNNE